MKKFASVILSGLFALVSLTPFLASVRSASATQQEVKQLDVYVIAGQSNAVGCSNVDSVSPQYLKDEYTNGFENVYFYNRSEGRFEKDLYEKVKFGQGATDKEFGAEIGIADTLLSNGTQTETLIIKCAYGATYLTDNTSNNASKRWGNWCPPSMPRSNETISATDAEVGTFGAKLSGHLYDKCMATVEEAVEAYESEGYKANLKGTFWMQGETDAQNSVKNTLYETYLKALISDLRAEYTKLSLLDAETSPFVIGKIAPTFNWDNTTTRAGVQVVRAVQDKVALETPYVVTVETEDYIIVDPATGTFTSGCHDKSHFGADDMVRLGRDVGEACTKPNAEMTVVGNGSYEHKIQDGYDVFTLIPAENASIFEVLVDGVDMVIDVILGGNTFRVPRNAAHTVKITFA